ncbi:MAG: MFS transporter [Syntrophomonadaceae bacterium]|nr:MFS transporter [Syntrophomonadaceae bacterium]
MANSSDNDSQTKTGQRPVNTIWTKNFTLLCLANIALFMSIQVLLPTLPVYLFMLGGSYKEVGYAMGAFTICSMLMRPIAGYLVDSWGRKRIITLGLFLVFAVSWLYQLSNLPIMIIVTRGLHGLAFGLVGTAVGTIVADSLPLNRLSEGMGYFGLTTSLSMAVAPIIGFWLADTYGYSNLFLWVIGMSFLALILSIPVQGAKIPLPASTKTIGGIAGRLVEKSSLPASVVMLLLSSVYGSVLSFIALYASESGIANIGFFFTAMAISMLISRPFSGRWADQGGSNTVLLIGYGAIISGLITIVLSHSISGLMLAGAVFGFGFGFCIPTLQAFSIRFAPAHRRGAATATFFIALDLGIGLGTIIWGYVAAASNYQVMYVSALLPVILAVILYYVLKCHGFYARPSVETHS